MGSSFWDILGRVLAVIAVLVLVGICIKLVAAILTPVLPTAFMDDLKAGWQMLRGLVSGAIAPIMAVVILGAICWIVMGRRG